MVPATSSGSDAGQHYHLLQCRSDLAQQNVPESAEESKMEEFMKTEQIKRIEVHTVMLQEGTDYQSEDLVPDRIFPGVRMLPNEKLQQIAQEHLFDRCSWRGEIFPDIPNQHSFRAQFERTLKG